MMQGTVIFGLPGAGKSALARSLIHDFAGPPAAWFADDDRTLNFDATCLDLHRSDWASQRMIWFRNGSCFVLNLDLSASRMESLRRAGIHHIFIVCAGDPLELAERLRSEAVVEVTRSVLVMDARFHLRELTLRDKDTTEALLVLERYLALADIVVVNKRDLVSREDAAVLKNWLTARRGDTLEIIEARFGKLGSSPLGGGLVVGQSGHQSPSLLAQAVFPSDQRRQALVPQRRPDLSASGRNSLAP